jgi:hypothetical protein
VTHQSNFTVFGGNPAAIISNLVSIACVSILPGFGENGLLISNSIQMLISAVLEIPTGYYADRYGWANSVKIGLTLKVLVTVLFMISLYFSFLGLTTLVWLFFAAEAITDSFASTFISGSYQSAFLRWYDSRLGLESVKPPLFLASFAFGLRIRFLLPVVVMIFALFIGVFARKVAGGTPYVLAFILFTIVLVLRVLVYRVNVKLLSGVVSQPESQKLMHLRPLKIVEVIVGTLRNPSFLIYGNAVFLSSFAVFFVIGTLFKTIKTFDFSVQLAWVLGALVGLGLYLARTAFSVFVFPRLGLLKKARGLILVHLLVIAALIINALIAMNDMSKWLFAISLFGIGVVCAVCADATQKYIESDLNAEVGHDFKATWISCANSIGYLLFGIISGIVAFQNGSNSGMYSFTAILVVTSLSAVVILGARVVKGGGVSSFSGQLRAEFRKVFTWILVGFSVFDLMYFSISSFSALKVQEQKVVRLISNVVSEPLMQGSFLEASRRIKDLEDQGVFQCAELSAWDFKSEFCGPESRSGMSSQTFRSLIYLPGQKDSIGAIGISFDRSGLYSVILLRFAIDITLIVIIAVFMNYVFIRVGRRLSSDLKSVVAFLGGSGAPLVTGATEFQFLVENLQELMASKVQHDRNRILTLQSLQVAHDIRSPLSALEMLSGSLAELPEEKRTILRNSINRIRDIANSLGRNDINSHGVDHVEGVGLRNEQKNTELLMTLVESIVTESRIRFREKLGLNLDFNQTKSSYGLFSEVQTTEFKRLVSNLINNAVESLSDFTGNVSLSLYEEGAMNVLKIEDNGKGIPEHLLKKLGERGATFEKAGGSGLGIHHALNAIRSLDGKIEFRSKVGLGTQVLVFLPKQEAPAWFLSKLHLGKDSTLVVFDDDQSIHQIWKGRLDSLQSKEVNLVHLGTPMDLRKFFGKNFAELDKALFLMDFEILGHKESGLDMIEELGLQSQSILVTSRYEESHIRDRCERLGVKLIPKSMSGFIPIVVT